MRLSVTAGVRPSTSLMSIETTSDYWLLPEDRLPSNGTQVRADAVVNGNASGDVMTAASNASTAVTTVAAAKPQRLADMLILSIVCVGLDR